MTFAEWQHSRGITPWTVVCGIESMQAFLIARAIRHFTVTMRAVIDDFVEQLAVAAQRMAEFAAALAKTVTAAS